jgi:hypothetical protein
LGTLILEAMMNDFKLLSVILVGLWLAACAHTNAPEVTKPQEEEPKQTTQESPITSKTEPAKGQGASEKSQTSQADSQAVAKDNHKQTAGKVESGQPAPKAEKTPDRRGAGDRSQSSQPPSTGVASTQQKATEKSASSHREAYRETASLKLEEARRNLRISEATEKRIATELEQLKKAGSVAPETLKNYEIYHESVQKIVAQNRKMVEQMEAAKTRHSSQVKTSETTARGELENILDPKIPEEQTRDEVVALDRQLSASLNEFDAKLLREMDDIHNQSSQKMRDLAQEAAEAARRLREKGIDVDSSRSEPTKESEETETKTGQGPASYADDDIVARQLREAAENETDPELKEKLWKEYHEYKKNQSPDEK